MVDYNTFYNELSRITGSGNYGVQPKLNPSKPTEINMQTPSLGNYGGNTVSTGGGGTELDKLMRAIKQKESTNNYRAINRDSGALGGYQIMPFNLFGGSEWDRKALGRDVSREEFLGNPQIQDAIARWQLGNYLKKYGAAGAAAAWYGGEGSVKNMYSTKTQTGGYPSIYAYWKAVLDSM